MKYDSREDARKYLESLGGEDGRVISGPSVMTLQMPTIENAYDRAVDDNNEIEYQDYYKAEYDGSFGYWQMYIKKVDAVWAML